MPTTRHLFIAAAFNAATDHNVLIAADRAEFASACNTSHLDEAESWARLVVYDMSTRCRSFRPAELDNLIRLAAENA